MASGKLWQYTNKKGEIQKGVAFHDDQTPAFTNHGKVFLRLINDDDDLSDMVDKNGKRFISLKNQTELTLIGFVD